MFRRFAAVMSGALPFSALPMAHMPEVVVSPRTSKPAPVAKAQSVVPKMATEAAKAEADMLAIMAWSEGESPVDLARLSAEESELYKRAFGEPE